jgi:hypothetical protein
MAVVVMIVVVVMMAIRAIRARDHVARMRLHQMLVMLPMVTPIVALLDAMNKYKTYIKG